MKSAAISHKPKEEAKELVLDFKKLESISRSGVELLPVIAQNALTGEVLLLAYANRESLEQSLQEQKAVFWSTSRKKLWRKGSTSGDYLDLLEIRVNCEQNSLLYRVIPRTGGVCHTEEPAKKGQKKGQKRGTCFYRRLQRRRLDELSLEFIDRESKQSAKL